MKENKRKVLDYDKAPTELKGLEKMLETLVDTHIHGKHVNRFQIYQMFNPICPASLDPYSLISAL